MTHFMKSISLIPALLLCCTLAAQPQKVSSPDGRITVTVTEDAFYSV